MIYTKIIMDDPIAKSFNTYPVNPIIFGFEFIR
jgi:hypothetical protein